jgi:hypothetical protein
VKVVKVKLLGRVMMFKASKEKVDKGLAFQSIMMDTFKEHFVNVVDSRVHIMKLKPNEKEVVYNTYESKNGDIIIESVHLECVTVAKSSIFPETKLKNFKGKKHYYIFHLDDTKEVFVVPSYTWNCYMRKCKKVSKRGRMYRSFKAHYIRGLRRKKTLQDFIQTIKGDYYEIQTR